MASWQFLYRHIHRADVKNEKTYSTSLNVGARKVRHIRKHTAYRSHWGCSERQTYLETHTAHRYMLCIIGIASKFISGKPETIYQEINLLEISFHEIELKFTLGIFHPEGESGNRDTRENTHRGTSVSLTIMSHFPINWNKKKFPGNS